MRVYKSEKCGDEVFYSLLFYIFKEYAGNEVVFVEWRKQEQIVVLLMREMRKVEARPHDSWHRSY